MKKALAVAVVLASSSAAFAVETPLPNGSFELDGTNVFTQSITNWLVSVQGVPGAGTTLGQQSGLFTTLGKFSAAPIGSKFVMLSNLGGTGSVTLISGASGVNFAVAERNLQFRWVYLTNDPSSAATHDQFRVHVDFFTTASGIAPFATLDRVVSANATLNDTGAFNPFNTGAPAPTTTFNDSGTGGNTFNTFNLDVSPFFGSFARVSFIVDTFGPGPGTNGNGVGISGVVLDNVILNPEPSAIALFALGAMGLGGFAWRRRSAKKPAA